MLRQSWLEGLIGLLAIVSILVVAIDVLVVLPQVWLFTLYAVDLGICLVFAGEFVLRLLQSRDKAGFLRRYGFEVLAMVPALALYGAGTLPAISAALRSLRLVRVFIIMARTARFLRVSGGFIRRSGLVYLFAITVSIIFLGAVAAFLLEGGTPQAQITNFSDSLWWSISTVTTVGYGDIVPRTVVGRAMGMGLMAVGIGVMSAFISGVSATLVEARLRKLPETRGLQSSLAAEIKSRIDRIEELEDGEVALLMEMIKTLRGAPRV